MTYDTSRQVTKYQSLLLVCKFLVTQIKSELQAGKQDDATEAFSPDTNHQTVLDRETTTKIRSEVVFYIKCTHSYIQKTFLQELTDFLLGESVWLLAQTTTWPFLYSFSRQCGSLGKVTFQPTCSPLCSWLTAPKKSLMAGCRLH